MRLLTEHETSANDVTQQITRLASASWLSGLEMDQ
jgi:hypothetical protein